MASGVRKVGIRGENMQKWF